MRGFTTNRVRLALTGGLLLLAGLAPIRAGAAANGDRLVDAAKRRDIEQVRTLLQQGADPDTAQPDGARALHWAAHWDEGGIADLLIAAGADVNAANAYGVTPLALASVNGSAAMVMRLLNGGAGPDATQFTGETALMTAARSGSVEAVGALLAHGATVEGKESARGQNALMWAAAQEHSAVVRLLLQHGADPNARSAAGFTPLMFAARHGNLETATALLDGGARLGDAAGDGSSPLQVATVRGHIPLVKLMLARGADPNASTAGYTPLHWAAGSWETDLTGNFGIDSFLGGVHGPQKAELVNTLLDYGADVNARVAKNPPRFGFSLFRLRLAGATPFFLAAMAGDPAVMALLLSRGADPTLVTADRTTPLMVAAGIGRVVGATRTREEDALAAVRMLLKGGADVSAVSDAGETAVFGPAYTGADLILQELVDRGSDVNVVNKAGQTPLDIAEADTFASGAAIFHKSTAALLRQLGGRSGKASAESPQ